MDKGGVSIVYFAERYFYLNDLLKLGIQNKFDF